MTFKCLGVDLLIINLHCSPSCEPDILYTIIKVFDMLCRFLSTEKGGHLAETDGTIVRKWKWPVNNVKLTTPINIQVSGGGTCSKCYTVKFV